VAFRSSGVRCFYAISIGKGRVYLFGIEVFERVPWHVLRECEGGEFLSDRLEDDFFQCIDCMETEFCNNQFERCFVGSTSAVRVMALHCCHSFDCRRWLQNHLKAVLRSNNFGTLHVDLRKLSGDRRRGARSVHHPRAIAWLGAVTVFLLSYSCGIYGLSQSFRRNIARAAVVDCVVMPHRLDG